MTPSGSAPERLVEDPRHTAELDRALRHVERADHRRHDHLAELVEQVLDRAELGHRKGAHVTHERADDLAGERLAQIGDRCGTAAERMPEGKASQCPDHLRSEDDRVDRDDGSRGGLDAGTSGHRHGRSPPFSATVFQEIHSHDRAGRGAIPEWIRSLPKPCRRSRDGCDLPICGRWSEIDHLRSSRTPCSGRSSPT